MERLDTNVGSRDAALQQRPEVLKAVGVDATVDVLDGVIDNLVGIVAGEPFIAEEEVGVESRSRFDVLANLSLQDGLATALDNHSPYLAPALKDAHNGNLVFGASTSDTTLANAQVHVASLAADEGLIRFNLRPTLAAQLHQGTALHCETDAVEHEPCRLLSDAQSPSEFTGANAVLGGSNDPHSGKPLFKSEWRVLKDGAYLDAELLSGVLVLALPKTPSSNELHFLASAGGAGNPIRPALSRKGSKAVIGVCEVDDGFLKGGGGFHEPRIGELCY